MTARGALAVACVLWPSLRTPVALVDLAVGLAERVRLDDAGQLRIGDEVMAGAAIEWSSIGLGVAVDTPHPDDPGAYPTVALRVQLGPVAAWVEYENPDELVLEARPVPGRVAA